MKKISNTDFRGIGFVFFLSLAFYTFSQNKYEAVIDLTSVENDKAPVTIKVPAIDVDSIEFHIPKIVPGTYSISDFGRFVTDFIALDSLGNQLPSRKIDSNRWLVQKANKLHEITYRVDDSYDRSENYQDNFIFEPGGTNIDKNKKAYVINTFGFIGYVDGKKDLPFELTVRRSEKLYGSTALERINTSDSSDTYYARNYHFLADGPLMYCPPDTVTQIIDGTEILVSVYSPGKKLSAEEVMSNISGLMEAQSKYLNGLPVKKYAYLIYLTDSAPLSGGMGALEHSYSSVYFLPEVNVEQISQTVKDVAAHEFLHIVTPLNIHSEEIHYFNYIEPDMSEHLWLYEGVTEYSSMHVQVRYDLYDSSTFLENIREKMFISDNFPDVSFTKMSANILEPEFKDMYTNVYYKGALIAMCLDLYLIKYSDGKMDLPSLMRELAKKYGPAKSFKDEELFDVIEELTYPEIGDFLEVHVGSDEPLPYAKCLDWAGISYSPTTESESFTLGGIGIGLDDKDNLIVAGTSQMNKFGKEMGYKEGDILVTINDVEIKLENIETLLDDLMNSMKEGKKVKAVVKREVGGKLKEVKLKAKARKVKRNEKHKIEFIEGPTPDQLRIRKAWLQGLN